MKIAYQIFLILTFNLSFCQSEIVRKNLEGFYSSGWEYSNFREIDFQNCFLVKEHWTSFMPNLLYNGKPFDLTQIPDIGDVYLKVNAIQKTDGSKGHMAAWNSEIIITEILEIDVNRNFHQYIIDYGPIKKS